VTTPRPPKVPESVLVVIYTPALEVLLLERADAPGYWQSVTGSKDSPGEALLDTCVREVEEETGIRVATIPPGGAGAPPSLTLSPAGEGEAWVPLSNLRDWRLVNRYEIYPRWRHRYAPGVTHNTEHVYGLQVPAGTPVRLAPREHLRHLWLPWREAADRCFSPSNAEALLQLPRFAAPG
jgi:dihydroneopterin triphosphate diphosphatase